MWPPVVWSSFSAVTAVTTPSETIDGPQLLSKLNAATEAAKSGDKEAAISQLKQLLDINPRHELANGMLASIYAELGLIERAIHFFQKVLDHHPANVLARFQLGVLLLTHEQPQRSLDVLQPMLSMDDDFLGHFHSGLALVALGRPEQARKLFQQAAKRMPANHPLYEKLQAVLKASE